ncbi:MAG: dTDP-4-dehydrorhamnose reductase [Treponema sp.]|nr:dTDP-4-dehydrorhamnose reductase [Treponema sp.]
MIWLIGCKGMLGTEIARQLDEAKLSWVGTDREIDITNPQELENFENSIETASYFPSEKTHSDRQIKWIINCAAYTNVDKAEEDTELAAKLNCEGPKNIARLARKIGAKLIHISTDYVFNGEGSSPYTEDMEKEPLGVYGKTKSDGEDAIQKEMNQYYIIRTAWLYGFDGKNFVYTMTKLMNSHDSINVVNDQFGTPTCTLDLAAAILKLIEKADNAKEIIGPKSAPAFGIYHFSGMGEISWFDFAEEIYKLGKKYKRITAECKVNPCTTEEFGAKVKRPHYSVLCKDKITKELKIKIPTWQQSLERFIKANSFNPL